MTLSNLEWDAAFARKQARLARHEKRLLRKAQKGKETRPKPRPVKTRISEQILRDIERLKAKKVKDAERTIEHVVAAPIATPLTSIPLPEPEPPPITARLAFDPDTKDVSVVVGGVTVEAKP